jgi:hypothetical protein
LTKPAEVKPKLQSTAALDKQIASLEKYSNVDEVKGRYADLQNQIKELQASKKDRDAQAAQAAKDYNAAIAAINKEKAANLTSLNADFANRIKRFRQTKVCQLRRSRLQLLTSRRNRRLRQTRLEHRLCQPYQRPSGRVQRTIRTDCLRSTKTTATQLLQR